MILLSELLYQYRNNILLLPVQLFTSIDIIYSRFNREMSFRDILEIMCVNHVIIINNTTYITILNFATYNFYIVLIHNL